MRRIGVDEKAAAKGHKYLTLVCDLDEGTVEYLAEDRTQESLDGYYAGLTPAQLDGLEAVAMDMWEPFIQSTRARVPEAAEKIVFDRFHIMGHVGKAVDSVFYRSIDVSSLEPSCNLSFPHRSTYEEKLSEGAGEGRRILPPEEPLISSVTASQM